MSAWWLERSGRPPHPDTAQPALVGTAGDLLAALEARREAYVPEWTRRDRADAGVAFRDLVLELTGPVLGRVNRLPEKSFVEFLNLAGISALGPRPASAFVVFTLLDSATESVQLPAGFQLSAPASGGGDEVFFETEDALFAAPLTLGSLATQVGGRASALAPPTGAGASVLPFGARPEPGSGFLLGFSGTAALVGSVTLLVSVTPSDAAPAPAAAGGLAAPPTLPPPALQWSVLDGGSWVALELLRDETASLTRTGLIELRAPARWRAGNPAGVTIDPALRWLRVQLLNGRYPDAPRLGFVQMNAARVLAGRTVHGELLTAVPGSARRRFSLSQFPILPKTLLLEVDEGSTDGVTPDAAGQSFRPWQEVDDFSHALPGDRVFTVDPETGTVFFGDDRQGRSVPDGAGNVRAVAYRAAAGTESAVAAAQITTLVSSLPSVTAATNPLAASGGAPTESRDDAIRRGPEEVRARGRAVTSADYALLARRAPGARIARAHAVAAFDARFPGPPSPGVVSVFVVTDAKPGQVPLADDDVLRNVASYLAASAAPLGVEIVAAVPAFQRVAVSAEVELAPGTDPVRALHAVSDRLDFYLHPLTGGDDGQGWPFGGPIRYGALVRAVMDVALDGRGAVSSVARLNFKVDGRPVPACTDQAIVANSLVWPGTHQISTVRGAA